MPGLQGTVVIAQKGRLHVIDDERAGHLFTLRAQAAAETERLEPLQARQARGRVNYSTSPDGLRLVAERIELTSAGRAAQATLVRGAASRVQVVGHS